MKDILTQEDITFLKSLSKEIQEQDTRCTAKPYGLIIGKKERQVCDYDNCDNKAIYFNQAKTTISNLSFKDLL